MKVSLIASTLVAPLGFGAAMLFHPGVPLQVTSLASVLPASTFKESASYTLDPMHTSVGFQVGHLGLSQVQGRFDKVAGKLSIDPDNLAASSVDVTVETDSVDTAVAPRDADLKSPNFLDAQKFPTMTFKSTGVRPFGDEYIVDGDLTLKSVTKPISITFKKYGPITDPWGGTRIGFVAEPFKLNRQDYGVAYNVKLPDGTSAVSDTLNVVISMEATKNKQQ